MADGPQDTIRPMLYVPRPFQTELHQKMDAFRFGTIVCHRRFGKTVASINHLIYELVRNMRVNPFPQVAYIAPTYKRAKATAWEMAKYYTSNLNVSVNESELRIDLPTGARLRLYGSDDPDALRGIYLDCAVLDEYDEMSPRTFTEIVRPLLGDYGGKCYLMGTMQGRQNLWKALDNSKTDPEWFSAVYKQSETHILSDAEVESMRRSMSEEEFMQEMECFTEGTLVCTSRGHYRIETIRVGDSCLTHRRRWRMVMGVMSRQYSGSLFEIKANGSPEPLRCTPDHPFLVYDKHTAKTSWKLAKNLEIDDCLFTPKPRTGKRMISDAWAKLIAWYICEGSVSQTCLVISHNYRNKEERERIFEILDSLGLRHKIYSHNPCAIYVMDTSAADRLVSLCGSLAENKRIPFDVISGHEEVFFRELMLGDGCFIETTQGARLWVYSTISKSLAFDVVLLCASIGRRASMSCVKAGEMISPNNGKTYKSSASYSVRIPYGQKVNHSQKRLMFPCKNGIIHRVKAIGVVEFSGTLYNLSVKEDESYVVQGRAVHNCSSTASIIGAYWSKEMSRCRAEGRVGSVAVVDAPVDTYWDLGIGVGNAMAIWFGQRVGDEVHFIDSYEAEGAGFPHFIGVLSEKQKERGYVYGTHYAPHDIAVRELGTGKSRLEIAAGMGLNFVPVPRVQDKGDSIEAARRLIEHSWFDSVRCARGVECLEQYRREWIEERRVWKSVPRHDATSNFSDGFQQAAMAIDIKADTVLLEANSKTRWGSSL